MKRFAVSVCAVAALAAASVVSAQDWIALQDGKTLAGWKTAERPESWVVEDGAFVSRGERSHLFYVGKVAQARFQELRIPGRGDDFTRRQQRHLRAHEVAGPGLARGRLRAAGHQFQSAGRKDERLHRTQDDRQHLRGAQHLAGAGRRQRLVHLPHPRRRQDHPDFHQRQADLRIRGRSDAVPARKTRRGGC